MVKRRYIIPSRIHSAYSPIGRWIRRRCGDSQQAESLHIAAVALTGFGLILAQALSMALLPSTLSQNAALLVGALAVFVLLFLAGRQPKITIEVQTEALVIRREARETHLPFGRMRKTSIIDDQLYHRHYRRFARTMAFVNRIPATVLLIDTPEGPVILGVSESEQQELRRLLATAAAPYEVA